MDELPETEDEWKDELSSDEFQILRQAGTEQAFSGEHYDRKDDGTYACAGCGQELFNSDDKFKSGSGWPSYTQPIDEEAIETVPDHSHGMERTEVVCARCDGHLGHVFNDGPEPTGLRYCINSQALNFLSK